MGYYDDRFSIKDRTDFEVDSSLWVVLSQGRYIPASDCGWLIELVGGFGEQVVAVNMRPELGAFEESVKVTSSGQIAGFRRFYVDSAREVSFPDEWPHLLFIRKGAVGGMLGDGGVPVCFGAFGREIERLGLSKKALEAAGDVMDVETEAGLLTLMRRTMDSYSSGDYSNGMAGYSGVRIEGKVFLGKDVEIAKDTLIVGPCIIGDNVKIGRDVMVRSSIVGAGQVIDRGAMIQNRVVMGGSLSNGGIDEMSNSRCRDLGYIFCGRDYQRKKSSYKKWPRLSYVGYFKRLADIVFSVGILLLFVPVFPFIALVIKVSSPGAVFFGHKRQGYHGREFLCLKFRTMVSNADELQSRLRVLNKVDGPQFKMEDDPRVNSVGKFLRDTCLDEIPQFINVLKGQMSVVGPRPSPEAENSLCPPWHDARLSVRPGITGLWQICRTRKEGQDFQEWVFFDTSYVKKVSLRLDLWICWRTVIKLVRDFVRQF